MNKAAHRDAAAKRRAVAHVAGGAQAAQRACAVISDILVARFGAQLGQVVLAGYMPMRSEISPLPAMLAHPGPVCVPVITARATPLEFHRWSAQTPMQRGQFGADIPVTADLLVPDVLIAPLLAYDPRGYRLGYGGGVL